MKGASLPRRSWLGIVGAALLVASGAIHLDLYLTGYRTIPTIGPLFLLQVIAAFVLAAAGLLDRAAGRNRRRRFGRLFRGTVCPHFAPQR